MEMKSEFRQRACRLIVIVFMLASASIAADKKQLEAAVAAVDANLKTTAGQQYDQQIGKEFPEKYRASMRQCKEAVPAGTRIAGFDMLIKLGADGKVQEVLVYPETQMSECARAAVVTGKFSNPPHGDYWINIRLELKR
jgi:hypothetical protein